MGFTFGNEIGLSKMNVFGICDNVQTQSVFYIRMSGVNNLQLCIITVIEGGKWLQYNIQFRHVCTFYMKI